MYVVCSSISFHQIYTKKHYEAELKDVYPVVEEFKTFEDARRYAVEQYQDELLMTNISLNKTMLLRKCEVE